MVTTRRRILAKALTWRATATLDTFIIRYLVTGSGVRATSIACVEVLTMIAIYDAHERAWSWVNWGRG